MDVANLSMVLNKVQVHQQVNLSLMKDVMSVAQIKSEGILEMMNQTTKQMELSVNPHIGANIDIRG
ncbi:putative motility protein [Bacillus sp. HMF5848]|uniref:YjfB family protein n=1 Tax=Bacillus sp. HMF5848 TaxID=2495421 RepID=UPI000F7B6A83|nr:YjfB family protein [Bacillus sp. HMF5848]RSK28611.1 putative motility protein [Bacillus sp. HMF5848]